MSHKFPEINQVACSGRLTRDPDSRITETGKLLVTFVLAANRSYRDHNGDWQQDTTFVPVSVWDKTAEYVAEHLHKASSVFLTGRLKSRTIKSSAGKRTVLEVVARNIQFLDKKVPTQASHETPDSQSKSDISLINGSEEEGGFPSE